MGISKDGMEVENGEGASSQTCMKYKYIWIFLIYLNMYEIINIDNITLCKHTFKK